MADATTGNTETWDAKTGSFTYDANGNVATAPAPYSITAASYNYQNLPASITRNDTTTTYRYDDAGQRITKQVGGGSTQVYVQDGATTLGVFIVDATGTPTSWYFNVLAEDKVVGRQPSTGNRSYYHTDLLGSTRSVVQSVTVVESYDFDPWGLLMPGRTLGSGTKEGFTGKEQDVESGLDYFGARYYMPALARWAGVDAMADGDPAWSPYNYVLDNPLNSVDPSGLTCVTESLGGTSADLNASGGGSRSMQIKCTDVTPEDLTTIQAFLAQGDAHSTAEAQNPPQGPGEARSEAYLREWRELGGPPGWTPPFPVCRGTARCSHWRTQNKWAAAAALEAEMEQAQELALAFSEGGGKGIPGRSAGKLLSRIGQHPGLTRVASSLSGGLQRSIDNLTAELAKGNLNPGIGTKHLFGDIFYARARDGARVFFRNTPQGVEILAKATKQNEARVISILEKLYK